MGKKDGDMSGGGEGLDQNCYLGLSMSEAEGGRYEEKG